MDVRVGDRVVRKAAVVARIVSCVAVIAAPLHAQAIVKGILYNDSTGSPVRGRVMLVDPSTDAPVVHIATDSVGAFLLKTPAGVYQLAAVRDGFMSTMSAPISLANGEQLTLRVPIAVDGDIKHHIGVIEHVRPSADVASQALESGNVMLSGFDRRRQSSSPGMHYGRAELARSGYSTLGEFLSGLPGLSVLNPTSAGTVEMARNLARAAASRSGPGSCHVGWFVDGHRMDFGQTFDPSTDALGRLQLDAVDAVEVFRGLSEMPAEFATPDLRCGAIAIWTRRN